MTAAEAAFYLVDQMRVDAELRAVLLIGTRSHGYSDVYAWAEACPDEVIAVAESWADVIVQQPPDAEHIPIEL